MTHQIDLLTGKPHARYKSTIGQPKTSCPDCTHGHGGATKAACPYCPCVNHAMDQRRKANA